MQAQQNNMSWKTIMCQIGAELKKEEEITRAIQM